MMAVRVGVTEVGHRMCLCGHQETVHQHHRRGTDCSLCPGRACKVFRPAVVPPISNIRAFFAAALAIAGLYVVLMLTAMLRNVP